MTQLSEAEQKLFDEIVRAKGKLLGTSRPDDEAFKPIDEALEYLKSIDVWVDQLLSILPTPSALAPGAALDQQLESVLLGPSATDPRAALDDLSIDFGHFFDISPIGVSAAVGAKCGECSAAIANLAEAATKQIGDIGENVLSIIQELDNSVVEAIEGAANKLTSAIKNVGENHLQTPLAEVSKTFDDLGEKLEDVRSEIIDRVSKVREFVEKLLAIIDMIKALCVV